MINDEKSDLVPSQSATYLGMTIDTVVAKVFPKKTPLRGWKSSSR